MPALVALREVGLEPLVLEAKEGLALLNGTQLMTALGALLLADAERLTRTASVAAAMSVEALLGHGRRVRRALPAGPAAPRPDRGRGRAAPPAPRTRPCRPATRAIAHKVQDPYSLRCVPQVHGAVRDALDYLRRVLDIEMNSATDNPLVFPEGGVVDEDALATGGGLVISGGNFHGEPIALALDFAKLALAELGSISERRTALLLDAHLNGGLPAFLAPASGLESGMMLLQYTAAALASENKVLAHPASADSIPTSANQEDHVSMGPIAGAPRSIGARARRADRRDRAAVRRPGPRPAPGSGDASGAGAGGGRRRGASADPRARSATSIGTASRARTWRPRPTSCASGALAALAAPSVGARRRLAPWPIRIVDVTDEATFGPIPPCADPGFDHRSCDYWEDADRGSKAARLAWLETAASAAPAEAPAPPIRSRSTPTTSRSSTRSLRSRAGPGVQPVRRRRRSRRPTTRSRRRARPADGRAATRRASSACSGGGSAIFGSYAKVLLVDDDRRRVRQFGPLSAYPRAQRLRDLYPQLPSCAAARGHHLHRDDGGGSPPGPRPAARRRPSATTSRAAASRPSRPIRSAARRPTRRAPPRRSSGSRSGSSVAVDDERFPVVRRELG